MLKGEPGTRKSTAALSFPMPQYWFSWDRKMQGLLVPANKWGIADKLRDKTQFQFDDYDNWTKARIMLEKFQVNCPFNTLVFDSITSAADMTLRQTMTAKQGLARKSGAVAGKTIGGIAVNEIEDYNAESSALNELIALTKDIQAYNASKGKYISIILIAHVMEVTNKSLDGNMHTSRTIVTAGKRVAAKIPAYCSEVYHFGIKKDFDAKVGGQYAITTENPGEDFARTALNLPKEIVIGDDPLYTKYILPAINNLTQPTQPTNQPSNFVK
jgi:hypothetical protein